MLGLLNEPYSLSRIGKTDTLPISLPLPFVMSHRRHMPSQSCDMSPDDAPANVQHDVVFYFQQLQSFVLKWSCAAAVFMSVLTDQESGNTTNKDVQIYTYLEEKTFLLTFHNKLKKMIAILIFIRLRLLALKNLNSLQTPTYDIVTVSSVDTRNHQHWVTFLNISHMMILTLPGLIHLDSCSAAPPELLFLYCYSKCAPAVAASHCERRSLFSPRFAPSSHFHTLPRIWI